MALNTSESDSNGIYLIQDGLKHSESEAMWDSTVVPPTIKPALAPSAHLGLTVAYTVVFAFMFLLVYIQLWLILYYKHRRFSYQTVFLFLCLIWAGLRTTLFSFYYQDIILANNLALFPYWLLYCFPVCLQFVTLCLLVLFFAQVVFKTRAKYEPNKYKWPVRIALGMAALTFIATNFACAKVARDYYVSYDSVPLIVLQIRVGINGSLFVICGVCLSVCIYKMTKMSSANLVLEAKGTTVCQGVSACIAIILLYTCRAIYNMIAVSLPRIPNFGYNWINVSDQADMVISLNNGYAYISFGMVLFFWEVLPTLIVVLFFRVQRPSNVLALPDVSGRSSASKTYFFDNPRRYDSDDDLTRHTISSRGSGFENYGVINAAIGAGTPSQGYGSYHGMYGSTPPVLYGSGANTPAANTPLSTPGFPTMYEET